MGVIEWSDFVVFVRLDIKYKGRESERSVCVCVFERAMRQSLQRCVMVVRGDGAQLIGEVIQPVGFGGFWGVPLAG